MENIETEIVETERVTERVVVVPGVIGVVGEDARETLRALLERMGYGPDLVSGKVLTDLGAKLSEVASRRKTKDKPWSRAYLVGVLRGTMPASPVLVSAITAYLQELDGTPIMITRSHVAHVRAIHELDANVVVMGKAQPCANRHCPVWIVPVCNLQRYCSPECREAARVEHTIMKKEQKRAQRKALA
jgi:predicted nucleic acid-binding Zn ribbon protein